MTNTGNPERDFVEAENAIIELRGVGQILRELACASESDEWTPQVDCWQQFNYLSASIDGLCGRLEHALWPKNHPTDKG